MDKRLLFTGRQYGADPTTPAERRESGSAPTVPGRDCTVCKYRSIMSVGSLDASGRATYYLSSLHMCYYIFHYLM